MPDPVHKMDSEKSIYLDREEHVHKGELGAKRTVVYSYNSETDTLVPVNNDNPLSVSNSDVIADALNQLNVVLKVLTQAIVDPVTLDRSLNRTRQTAIIESGTVTTVGTVTGITNVDSYQGKLLMVGQDISAWANVVRGRIT